MYTDVQRTEDVEKKGSIMESFNVQNKSCRSRRRIFFSAVTVFIILLLCCIIVPSQKYAAKKKKLMSGLLQCETLIDSIDLASN